MTKTDKEFNTRLSPHFTLAEVIHTQHRGFATKQRAYLSLERCIFAARLAHEILEPLRSLVAKPVVPSSWLRCDELNRSLGGSPTSQHLTGLAADIKIPGGDLVAAFDALELAPIGQRILYLSPKKSALWLHVSLPEPDWRYNVKKRGWDTGHGFVNRDLHCTVGSGKKSYVVYVPGMPVGISA